MAAHTSLYCVVAIARDGLRAIMACNIPNRDAAEKIVAAIKKS